MLHAPYMSALCDLPPQVLLLDPLDFLHDLQDTATAIGAVYKLDGDEPLGYDAMEIKDADGTCRLWRTVSSLVQSVLYSRQCGEVAERDVCGAGGEECTG